MTFLRYVVLPDLSERINRGERAAACGEDRGGQCCQVRCRRLKLVHALLEVLLLLLLLLENILGRNLRGACLQYLGCRQV